jgi:acetyl-CoA acetyltransferase
MKRGGVAIAGVAESDLGQVRKGLTPIDLMAQGTHRALQDAGLTLRDVDGVFAANAQSRMATVELSEYLGIHPRYADSTRIGGASFISHLAHAHSAIEAGACDVAVIAYGSTQRSVTRAVALPEDHSPFESPYRPMLPVSAYAMAASRHMHMYGTTREQLAEVAVSARKWALLNPAAWEKEPLTVEDVLKSRMVSKPLTRHGRRRCGRGHVRREGEGPEKAAGVRAGSWRTSESLSNLRNARFRNKWRPRIGQTGFRDGRYRSRRCRRLPDL